MTRSPQTLIRSQSAACRSIHRNARYSTAISSAEYGSTIHAPNAANPSARPNDTMHSDAYTRQRHREPSESFRRETTQNSGSSESNGIAAPGMQASSPATLASRHAGLRWRSVATKLRNALQNPVNLSMDGATQDAEGACSLRGSSTKRKRVGAGGPCRCLDEQPASHCLASSRANVALPAHDRAPVGCVTRLRLPRVAIHYLLGCGQASVTAKRLERREHAAPARAAGKPPWPADRGVMRTDRLQLPHHRLGIRIRQRDGFHIHDRIGEPSLHQHVAD